MLIFHIIAGSFVLLFGYTALLALKGLRLHKFAGNIFFIAMVILSLSAAYLEYQLGDFPLWVFYHSILQVLLGLR